MVLKYLIFLLCYRVLGLQHLLDENPNILLFMETIQSQETFNEIFNSLSMVKDSSSEVADVGSISKEETPSKKSKRKRDEKIWYSLW